MPAMYVKSITLDGFKSYAQKQIINGFDPEFNAITGLNGSGKSNILDGICFVLGITNLSQVRCDQLTDLVYKKGAGGTNKATVSITFDNSDKQDSPVGFEHHQEITVTRQIIIGGRNKYMINGTNATNQRVADMFRSVGLNVNNPHFLIMQGRITKVLNMKPPEILGMIEEAAGTKMYDAKRINAEKIIQKKDAKVRDIDQLLQDEIVPQVNKLKEDKAHYMEYKKLEKELEEIQRRLIAHKYIKAMKAQSDSRSVREKAVIDGQQCKKNIEENLKTIEKLKQDIVNLQQTIEKEGGAELEKLEETYKESADLEAKVTARSKDAADNVKSAQKKIKEIEKSIVEDEKALVTQRKKLADLEKSIGGTEAAGKADQEELRLAQEMIQLAAQGLSTGEDGQAQTLAAQLITKQSLSELDTKKKQAEMNIKHLKPQLVQKEKNVKQTEKNYGNQKSQQEKLKKEILELKAQLAAFNYDDEEEMALRREQRQMKDRVHKLESDIQRMKAHVPSLDFAYDDPVPNFDRAKVKGLVGKLFSVESAENTLAIEVVLGDRALFVSDRSERPEYVETMNNVQEYITKYT